MLEGIEVLNKIEVKAESFLFVILMGVFLVLGISLFIMYLAKVSDLMLILGWISLIMFVVSVILLVCIRVPTGEYHYQVTIDENVSMVEFFEKYEIIDTQGKIYTIKEKE